MQPTLTVFVVAIVDTKWINKRKEWLKDWYLNVATRDQT